MTSLVNIVQDGGLATAGGALCYLLLWWKDRNLKEAKRLEAEALLAKARNEAEALLGSARVTANQEALKLRQEIDKSFSARCAERAELERRLGEREALINSQLERVVEAENRVNEQQSGVAPAGRSPGTAAA